MKKLLSFVLAFSMMITVFNGVAVSAINFDDEVAFTGKYTPPKIEFSDGKITVTQDYFTGDIANPTRKRNVVEITGGVDFVAFVEHIELGDPYGAPEDYNTYVAMNPGLLIDKYGRIYMYDYMVEPVGETEKQQQDDLNDFAELVSEILSTPSKDRAKLDGDDINDFVKAWKEAYATSASRVDTTVRYDALTQLRSNKRAIKNTVDANGNLLPGIYDAGDVADYNAAALFKAVYFATGSEPTSYLVYLNAEYERVVTEISYADQTAIMDEYYEKLNKVNSYVESDFTAAGWREVQEYLEEAEELATEANTSYEWREAIDALENARAVRGKPVDYTALDNALYNLFVNDIPNSSIYSGDDDNVYIYNVDNFVIGGEVRDEWLDFAGDSSGFVNGNYSAFTEAYRAWKSVRANVYSLKQSEIDKVLERLNKAVEALRKLNPLLPEYPEKPRKPQAFTGFYLPPKVTFSDGKITVTQDYYTGDIANPTHEQNVVEITGGVVFVAFVEHIELGEPYGAPEDYSAYVAMNPGLVTERYGKIYMYDYMVEPVGETEGQQQDDLYDFAEIVSEILSIPHKDKGYLDGDDINDFVKAWGEAYKTSFSKDDTAVRYDAVTQLRSNKRAIKNTVDANGDLKDGIYDAGDVADYNADVLFKAVFTATGSEPTSYLVYLNEKFNEIADIFDIEITKPSTPPVISSTNKGAYTGTYTAPRLSFSNGKITVIQDYYTGDPDALTANQNVVEITGGVDFFNFVEHIELDNPNTVPEDYSTYVAMNPGLMTEKYGKIYMYDYMVEPVGETEREQQNDLDDFAELLSEILSTPSKDRAKLDGDDINDFVKAWREAYSTYYSAADTAVRYDALTQLRSSKREIKNTVDANGNLKDGIYDAGDVADYNAAALFKDVFNATGSEPTSYLVYLNAELDRILSEISYADQTTIMDEYYEKLDKVTSYEEDDFTAAGWREVQEFLEEAEELAAEANTYFEWREAIDALDNAIAVRGKPVDYIELQDALADLFVGTGKASDIKPSVKTVEVGEDAYTIYVYEGNNDNRYVYYVKDFIVGNSVSQEWLDFAGDAFGQVDGENAAFTEAYKLWKSARSSATSVKQSELDKALENLSDAVDALETFGVKKGTCGENIEWILKDGVLTISGTGEMDSYFAGDCYYAPWYKYKESIQTIIIKNGVTTIGDSAFFECEKVTLVEIADTVIKIEDMAFLDCNALIDVYYDGYKYQWEKIENLNFNSNLTNANLHFLKDSLSVDFVPEKESLYAGKTFIMTFTQPETVVASTLNLSVNFDNTAFEIVEFVDVPLASVKPNVESCNQSGKISIYWTDPTSDANTEFAKHTNLLEVKFKVKDDVTHGVKSIKVTDYKMTGAFNDETFDFDVITPEYGYHTVNIGVFEKPTFKISGSYKAYGDVTEDTTVQLLSGGEVISSKVLEFNSGNYTFDKLSDGEYTLRISKKGHCTREYNVTVADADAQLDVEIRLYGDVNGDGDSNNVDVIQINRKINNMSSIFNQQTDADYRLKLANVTAITGTDTVINNVDAMQINRKINNMASVFDRLA